MIDVTSEKSIRFETVLAVCLAIILFTPLSFIFNWLMYRVSQSELPWWAVMIFVGVVISRQAQKAMGPGKQFVLRALGILLVAGVICNMMVTLYLTKIAAWIFVAFAVSVGIAVQYREIFQIWVRKTLVKLLTASASMETLLAEKYIDGKIPIHGAVLQSALNLYMHWYQRLDAWLLPKRQDVPKTPTAIAARSRELMNNQYERPKQLFVNFLGPSMKYSMGLWETGASTLEQAQTAMLDDFCEKAQIDDGHEILDLGCGFGSFATHVLPRYPSCSVVGLNLSDVQSDYVLEKCTEAAHPLYSGRFQLIRGDFNTVTLGRRFDRVVSIGFFEHISNLDLALVKIAGLLKPGGKCLLHYIVFRAAYRNDVARPTEDGFNSRYVFPGGTFWREDELFKHQSHLQITRAWFLNGYNYMRTAESWLENFSRNQSRIQAGCSMEQRFVRIWDLYLRASIAVFRANEGNFYGNGQYLLVKTEN